MVREFLVGVNNQFGATPLIAGVAVVLVALFVLFLYLTNQMQIHKANRRRREVAGEIYAKLVLELSLTPAQESLIHTLGQTLKEPDIVYPLLMDEHVFNHAVREFCKDHPVPPGLPALRKTIGFSDVAVPEREKNIQSTVQLESGQIISITYPKKRASLTATVIEVRKDGFLIQPSPPMYFDSGSNLLVRFFNNRGQYAGACHVRSVEHTDKGDMFLLSHSESLTKTQNRKFFRRMYTAPCVMTRLGEQEHPADTYFVELGGGGASIKDPDGVCVPGDIVSVDWKTPYGFLATRGKVVRITKSSHSGRCIHLEFEDLHSQTQDILFKILLKP